MRNSMLLARWSDDTDGAGRLADASVDPTEGRRRVPNLGEAVLSLSWTYEVHSTVRVLRRYRPIIRNLCSVGLPPHSRR